MPEDLMQVSGIGQKTFDTNQELIIVEAPKKK
jgi:DNA uptake protein ComE-like DNA-binding protein